MFAGLDDACVKTLSVFALLIGTLQVSRALGREAYGHR